MGDGQVTQKVPPLYETPLKRGPKRLTFFWVHFFHTRSGGSIQTPLTNGGPFCPLLGRDPTPRGEGVPSNLGFSNLLKILCQKVGFKSVQILIIFGGPNFCAVIDFFDKSDNTESVYFYDPKRLHYYIITFFKGSRTLPPLK